MAAAAHTPRASTIGFPRSTRPNDSGVSGMLLVKPAPPAILPCSASANSPADAHRSAGSFSSPRSMASSTRSGTFARVDRTRRGRSVSTRAMIACAVLPVCGGSPVSISYVTAASE